ncbi:sensor histidine kinase [Alicyclobacillus contaminans]|uniref:sensor histidine kinase n=1 Tax=Alicyclobacillus contaminans TaxID=392016 RepID=UPI0004224948|nr:HAMP domain-containing sensor histidine kinase [Alicyclobacillus contaminans]
MNRQRSLLWTTLLVLRGILLVLLCLAAAWTLAYFATDWLYRWWGHRPNGYTEQLVNSFLGVFLMAAGASTFGSVVRKRQESWWNDVMDTLRQIAQGNFNIRVQSHVPANEHHPNPFHEFVQTVNHMASALQELERMRQEFISNVSHEIQSPLTAISGFAKILREEDLSSEERSHYVDIIETESTRLSRLSDNLLKLTALESEHPAFSPTTYRLDRQLRRIVLSCEPLWLNKHLDMDVSLSEISIHADEDLMNQVWMNILHNAIKFTPDGGRIAVSAVRSGDLVEVRFSDTGIGLAEEDRVRIFERFYKADASRNRAAGGSGLGLAIAKKIVDMHGGTIAVESALGEGTTFTVRMRPHGPSTPSRVHRDA